MELSPHQNRVVAEKKELDEKLIALYRFIGGAIFPSLDESEQNRLKRQANYMQMYSDILLERIEAF